MKDDEIYKVISSTVSHMHNGPSRKALEGIALLALEDYERVLANLFVEIEDAATGLDLGKVPPTDLLPNPSLTMTIVNAAINEDVTQLTEATSDHNEIVPTLLAAIVALQKTEK